MDIKTLIQQHLDELFFIADQKEKLNTNLVVEIGAYVGAGVLRGRFSANKEVTQEEINGVFGVIGDFCKQSFGRSYTKVHFKKMTTLALELLQKTSFDDDLQTFLLEMQK